MILKIEDRWKDQNQEQNQDQRISLRVVRRENAAERSPGRADRAGITGLQRRRTVLVSTEYAPSLSATRSISTLASLGGDVCL